MQRATMDFGLPSGITLYAWRRSAGKWTITAVARYRARINSAIKHVASSLTDNDLGTNVANATDTNVARGMLGHEMDTSTFETSYQQGSVAIDVFNIAMDRDTKEVEQLVDSKGYNWNSPAEVLTISQVLSSIASKSLLSTRISGSGNSSQVTRYVPLSYRGKMR